MKKLLLILGVMLWTGASAAYAATNDELIEGAKLCTRQLPRYEREYGIPTHLLSAIASTESGRYHDGLRIRVPWPWTINAEGKGYFFPTKAEAINAVKKFRAHGIKSIDVGCMQVNLYHHPEAFSNLEEAFEPQNNVAYAANFLRNLYDEDHSWKKAAADYHSKTPIRGREYVSQVYSSWYQIIDKLRTARLQIASGAPVIQQASAKQPAEKKVAAREPVHMHSIQVSKRDSAKDVAVMRPSAPLVVAQVKQPAEAKPTTYAMAQSTTPDFVALAQTRPVTMQPLPTADAKLVRVDSVSHDVASARKAGPTFIFND